MLGPNSSNYGVLYLNCSGGVVFERLCLAIFQEDFEDVGHQGNYGVRRGHRTVVGRLGEQLFITVWVVMALILSHDDIFVCTMYHYSQFRQGTFSRL